MSTFVGTITTHLGEDAQVDVMFTDYPDADTPKMAHIHVITEETERVSGLVSRHPEALRRMAEACAEAADELEQAAERQVEASIAADVA